MARTISAASPEGGAPQASYILYTYNQAAFVEEAVRSALGQRDCRLDILISDDASTDDTYSRIEAAARGYRGPHRLRVRRTPHNLGMDHFPSLVRLAVCDIIIHAHGDDVARPHRARRILDVFGATGASVVSSNAVNVDEAGAPVGRVAEGTADRTFSPDDLIVEPWRPGMTGALMAFRRSVYEAFPFLDPAYLALGHDHLVPWRGALLGGYVFIGEPLLERREHAGQWHRRMTDAADELGRREIARALHLAVTRARRRDLDALIAARPAAERAALLALRGRLEARTAAMTEEWLDLREGLIRDGLRPAWDASRAMPPVIRRARRSSRKLAGLLRRLRARLGGRA
ncbi:glycosyltransferase [Prosthecomicrobium pneumaticum]|uniref:Glycosyltransferase 2-like domain-containing protein n=1 Tax=Prosthecomicrobium pneumaticum TaxID=81895 RepID=A0A7W9FJ48_9HYPH|nr:glycosyltransferase [Prosthecomicrobium pneumaticum]MBB5751135.1 hypothetical protein [Prosthecomicrobium pneumaticum]